MTTDVRQLTEPSTEPVTLAEARLWLRIHDDDTTQDAMLLLLITAARERAEAITRRALARRTFELRLDAFPADEVWPETGTSGPGRIWIPNPPLVSVESITYATGDGDVAMTGSPQEFTVDLGGDILPGRVWPLQGDSWPSAVETPGAIRIRYTAGYATASKMPQRLRHWIQARVSTWYEFREQIVQGAANELPRDHVDGLLDDLRARRFFA